MVDMFGNPVNPGDKIVFSWPVSTGGGNYKKSTKRSPLATARVDRLMAKGNIAVVPVFDECGRMVKELQLKSCTIVKYDWDKEVKHSYPD